MLNRCIVVLLGVAIAVLSTACSKKQENSRSTQDLVDSRVAYVENPCRVDEITIDGRDVIAEGRGSDRDAAEKECKIALSTKLLEAANDLCDDYTRIHDETIPCEAYRGNFNPFQGVSYNKGSTESDFFELACTNRKVVSYTCS